MKCNFKFSVYRGSSTCISRENFLPGLGQKPGSLALHASIIFYSILKVKILSTKKFGIYKVNCNRTIHRSDKKKHRCQNERAPQKKTL